MSTGEPQYKGKPDFAQMWLRHVDRVNQSAASQEGIYESYVRQQFRLLPTEMRNWVWDQKEKFMETKMVPKFKVSGIGTDLGYEDDPLVWNDDHTDLGLSSESGFTVKRDAKGNIDWRDPRIYSPKMVEREIIDYEAFNLLIMAASEGRFGWQEEYTNSIKGKRNG